MELNKKFTPSGLNCIPCWKNTPGNSVYRLCKTKDSEACKTCRKNCHVMRDCDNCPWLGTYRNRSNANSGNNGNASVNITADAEVRLLPPCSRPTAEVVKKGSSHLHFIFGFPKCPCCGKKPEKRSIEDCNIEIRKPKRLNVEDCDIGISKPLNIEDCGINI